MLPAVAVVSAKADGFRRPDSIAGGGPRRVVWQTPVALGLGAGLTAGVTEGLKRTVRSERPDRSDNRAFPSGHSAIAFMGATVLEREFGRKSPWITLGAYSVASGVGIERVIEGRHNSWQVVAGAGIGVLATRFGYWISDEIFGTPGSRRDEFLLTTEPENLPFLALETSMLLPFGRLNMGNGVFLNPEVALSVGAKAGAPLTDEWGLVGRLAVRAVPLYVDSDCRTTYVASLTSLGLEFGVSYSHPLNRRFEVNAEAVAGYFKYFGLSSVDDAVTTGWGTPSGRLLVGTRCRLNDSISFGAGVGCDVSYLKMSVAASDAYCIDNAATASRALASLSLNMSTRVVF